MNLTKKSDAVEPDAFMTLADGPLAPPPSKAKRKARDAPLDGLRSFLDARAKKKGKT